MPKETSHCVCKHCLTEFDIPVYGVNRERAVGKAEYTPLRFDLCKECFQKAQYHDELIFASSLDLPEVKGKSFAQTALAVHLRHQFIAAHQKSFSFARELYQKASGLSADEASALFRKSNLEKAYSCLSLESASKLIAAMNRRS